MAIRIGCGSWTDDAYVGLLFPKGAPKSDRLSLYAGWFERVELNASYYATPSRATFDAWCKQTPPGFLFDVKLHRRFSEGPRTAAQSDLVDRFFDAIAPLIEAKKLGGFLLTLAPNFGPKRDRLEDLDLIAERFRPIAPVAVELRNRGWVQGDALATTLDYFRQRHLSWVALDLPALDSPKLLPPIDEVTYSPFAYMRLHGRNPDYLKAKDATERHRHDYTTSELQEIAARVQSLAQRATDVHVSVNNHCENFAPKAAIELRRLLGQTVPPPLPSARAEDQLSLLD